MDKEKLKKILYDLEKIVEELKSEVYSDVSLYYYEEKHLPITDYDEIFEDDDGYPD